LGNVENKRAAKKHVHKPDTLESEFKNLYQFVQKVDLGPFRFFYSPDATVDAVATGGLFLQVYDPSTKLYKTLMAWGAKSTWEVDVRGPVNASVGTSMTDPGND